MAAAWLLANSDSVWSLPGETLLLSLHIASAKSLSVSDLLIGEDLCGCIIPRVRKLIFLLFGDDSDGESPSRIFELEGTILNGEVLWLVEKFDCSILSKVYTT